MAEPGDALQVRVDDEQHDRNRPEPAHDRVELEDGDQEENERGRAHHEHLRPRERSRRQLARGCPRVAGVDLGVDEAVETHRKRSGADHGQRDPEPLRGGRHLTEREQHPDVREREREDRVLELDERGEAPGQADGDLAHVCR